MEKVTLIDSRKRGRAAGTGEADAPPPTPPDPQPLYKKREPIHPKLVAGRFRAFKWFMLLATLGLYYVLPWLRWDRAGDASDQAVLADFAHARFYFFFLEIWPQEIYYLTGLLILSGLALFFLTSLFGRVWCGYTCPQTVWTDLFIAVERFFEGDRNQRIRLSRAPMSFDKAWRKVAKHVVWLLISFATGGAFILYFHDSWDIAANFFQGTAPSSAYVFSILLTLTTYGLAGTMREQVCTYMCPWPRIQAAMTDADALNVTYRSDRGEPRGPHRHGDTWEGRGDCIDCKQCVVVCPMGIDIRNGPQLECIHCALCIDACDGVMKKVGRPTGLIAYDTDNNLQRRLSGGKSVYRLVRPRTVLYGSLMVIVAGLMLFGLSTRATFELNILKDRSPPYVVLSDGSVRNGYDLKLVNKKSESRPIELSVTGIDGVRFEVVGQSEMVEAVTLDVLGNGLDRFRLLVVVPPGQTGTSRIRVVARDPVTGETDVNLSPFIAPRN